MRPMFTRLQKQRVRVDPETIAILEGDVPDAGRVAHFHGRAGIILALPEDVKAISSYSKPKGPVEPGWPFPKVRIRNNRNASPGNVVARFLMQASHDRPT